MQRAAPAGQLDQGTTADARLEGPLVGVEVAVPGASEDYVGDTRAFVVETADVAIPCRAATRRHGFFHSGSRQARLGERSSGPAATPPAITAAAVRVAMTVPGPRIDTEPVGRVIGRAGHACSRDPMPRC